MLYFFRSFSLVCFTSHGELLGSEDMDLDVMHMTLLAAMDCGEDQQCPLSALDIHQVSFSMTVLHQLYTNVP